MTLAWQASWQVNLVIICTLSLLLHLSVTLGGSDSIHSGGAMPMYNYIPGDPFGPDEWGTLSPHWKLCKYGQEQSPIAIDVSLSKVNQSLGSLQYTYMQSEGVLINLGHAVQVNLGTNAGSLVLGGDIYELKQFHFHTPSEHVINSTRFPLEMHLVHRTSDGKKLAVIGVVFRKGCHSHFLNQVWNNLANVTQKGANVSVGPVSFHKLHIGPHYARYPGSLTTPPCTQNVSWTIELSQCNTVSKSQLDNLKMVITESNARPLQKNIGSVEIY